MLCRFFTTGAPDSSQSFALLIDLERDAATRPSLSSWPHQSTPSGQMVDVGCSTLCIHLHTDYSVLGVLLNTKNHHTGATFASEILGQSQELAPFGRTFHEMWKSCKSMVGHAVLSGEFFSLCFLLRNVKDLHCHKRISVPSYIYPLHPITLWPNA